MKLFSQKIKSSAINIASVLGIPSIAVMAMVSKFVGHTEVHEIDKEKVAEHGFLHFTPKENIEKILASGYLKTGKIVGLEKRGVYGFKGMPDFLDFSIQDFGKGTNSDDRSGKLDPLKNPGNIYHAIKIIPDKEQLNDMETRPLYDDSIIYKGKDKYLTFEQADYLQIVLDCKMDETGNLSLYLRERHASEIENSPEVHVPSAMLSQYLCENKIKPSETKFGKKFDDLLFEVSSLKRIVQTSTKGMLQIVERNKLKPDLELGV